MNGENVFRLLRKMLEDKQVKTTRKLKAKTTNRNQKMKKELSKGDIFRKREEGFGYGTRLGEKNTTPNYGRLQTGHKLATWKMKEFDGQKYRRETSRVQIWWTNQTSGQWVVVLICFNIYTESGMRKNI